jgi:predicted dehydrogenase
VDLAQFITGERLTGVSALLETFVRERPVAAEFSGLHGTGGTERGPVTVDDAAVFLARLSGGGLGVFEATRFATGRKNAIRLEVNGERGSLSFDFEDMNVLHFHDATEDAATAGFRRIVVTEPQHAYVAQWWPAGHGLGYEHAFTHQVVDLVGAIAAGRDPEPSFADGLAVQRVLDAVERSAADDSRWVPLG